MNDLLNNLETILMALLTLSFFVERTVELSKKIICRVMKKEELPGDAKIIISVLVSVGTCVVSGLQVDYGFSTTPLINEIITGVILSGGSSFIHALLSAVSAIKDKNEVQVDTRESAGTLIEAGVECIAEPLRPAPIQYQTVKECVSPIRESQIDFQNGMFGDIKMSELTEEQKEYMRRYWGDN